MTMAIGLGLGLRPRFKQPSAGGGGASFAVVERTAQNGGSNFASSHNYTLGMTPNAGDLLVFAVSGTDASSYSAIPAGWTQLLNINCLLVVYKVATGSETAADVLTFTANTATRTAGLGWRIAGAGVPTGTVSAGGTQNPPAHSPAAGLGNYIWLTLIGWTYSAGMGATDPACTAAPAGFGNLRSQQNFPAAVSGSRGGIAAGELEAIAASQDPGTFTFVAAPAYGSSATIAIPPA